MANNIANGAKDTADTTNNAEPALTIESYSTLDSLKTPDGVFVDQNAIGALKNLALENKISPETAGKIAQIQIEAAQKQMEAFENMKKGWEAENAKTYGENLKNVETNCSRVLAELDKSGKFKELLALAGAEKHPATLEFLKNIGDLYLEKASVNPNETAGKTEEVSLEDFN